MQGELMPIVIKLTWAKKILTDSLNHRVPRISTRQPSTSTRPTGNMSSLSKAGSGFALQSDLQSPRMSTWRVLLLFSLMLNFLACIIVLRSPDWLSHVFPQRAAFEDGRSNKVIGLTDVSQDNHVNIERCGALHKSLASADKTVPVPVNPWRSLSLDELSGIKAWLEVPERELNLTSDAIDSRTSDNFIFLIEAHPPTKASATAYLADPANAPFPERYARVTVHHGGLKVPVVRNYLVGPLPLGDKTHIRTLDEIYHAGGDIPFNARGVSHLDEMSVVLAKLNEPIAHIMQALFGATAHGFLNDTLVGGMSGPFSFDGGFRRQWMSWRHNTAGSFLLPVDFYQYLDTSGTDPTQWHIIKHIYKGHIFFSTESFIEAFNNGTLPRPSTPPTVPDTTWTHRTRRGEVRPLESLPGPRSVSFAGLRFRVDSAQQHVSWLGWELFLGFNRDMGLSLWNVRFRGERIIYELSPQEALAQYGGNDPMQATTAWLDRYFGMGALVRNMLPHYDCPAEAVFLPAVTHTPLGPVVIDRAICIFEQDTGRPLTRHFGYEEGEFGATKSYVLTIRSTTTAGNYDYLFDYLFYLDGTIEVRLSASGYMQGGYWTPEQNSYGGRIRDTSMGNLHDHVINFKVDFDIAGTANSLLKTTTKQERVVHPWLEDDWGQKVIQQKITREYIESEDDSLLKYPPNFQGGYAIVNRESPNAWGSPRGYAVHPGYSPIHNTVVGSKRLLNNANWARYNLAVSRRKETEPASSTMWNLNLPGAPPVDFHRFFDGENITQADIVAWVNLGMHHLPQAEDSPHTKTTTATSSFLLTPLNYFDYDVSVELQNAVMMHPPEVLGDPFTFDDYGVKQDFNCAPEPPAPFDYTYGSTDGSPEFRETDDVRRAKEMYMRVRLGQ